MSDTTKPDLKFDEDAAERAIENDLAEPLGDWKQHPRKTEDFDDQAATAEYTHAAGRAQLLHSGVARAVRIMHKSQHEADSDINYDEINADILNRLDAGVPPGEPADMRLRRRVASLIQTARIASEVGNGPRAIIATELAFQEAPGNEVAERTLSDNAGVLEAVFGRFLGETTAAPRLAIPQERLALHELDNRVAFLLSRIDGRLSFEEILDVSAMPRLETYRHLCWMVLERILRIRERS